jgi:hypothetical protein
MAAQMMAGRDNPVCATCRYRDICDKPPQQYQAKYGVSELRSVPGELIEDPLHFQHKRGVVARG